ncbi:tyrosine-type recombinase/integrase [Bradyrhizobium sp. HKCCYLRH1065]|uniref:tyrosine-type recombinase/integrase n=1 Tax=Bradyrhizobium sp. HKCCYLRH1065 TaxID=3420753 RepID=UPI003EB81BFE
MAKTVQHTNLEFPKARLRLQPGRQPHWQALAPSTHLGYRRAPEKASGQWLLRRYLGGGNKYRVTPLGPADDREEANGSTVLSHSQARAKALAMIEKPDGDKIHRATVRQAYAAYVEHKRALGQSVADVTSRGAAHILPALGDLVISELTAERLQRWLGDMARAPAQVRPKRGGKPQYRAEPDGDEAIRRRRNTANRVLTMLKAILNYAHDAEWVSNRDAWGRRLKPFRGVDAPRVRYLSIAEAARLLNACDEDFRPLVRAALETGCRYGELARLEVADFNPDAGTIAIRKSKTSTARHVILTHEGAEFFKTHCAGKTGEQRMFTHGDGSEWKTAQQNRPMREACERAKIKPAISIHGMRHTWASHAVMNGVPLMVVAKNLGHVDTRMVERVYGHLAPSFIVDAVRAGAPRYGILPDTKVITLK